MALAFGHAGGGLVEQQHARFGRDRDRDFEQTLLAVRQRRGEFVHHVEQMEARKRLRDLPIDIGTCAHPPPPIAAAPETFGDGEANGLERRQIGIELIDLEGTREPAQYPLVNRQIGDVVAFE